MDEDRRVDFLVKRVVTDLTLVLFSVTIRFVSGGCQEKHSSGGQMANQAFQTHEQAKEAQVAAEKAAQEAIAARKQKEEVK